MMNSPGSLLGICAEQSTQPKLCECGGLLWTLHSGALIRCGFHGDLLPGNIVIRDRRLAGVIDWSGAAVGDPACDAMLAWALPRDVRADFRKVVGFDDATWARARSWVVQQTAMYIR